MKPNTIGDYSQKYQQLGHKFKDQLSKVDVVKAKFKNLSEKDTDI